MRKRSVSVFLLAGMLTSSGARLAIRAVAEQTPPDVQAVDGAWPVPPPVSVADGAWPVPPPVRVTDGAWPVPPPVRVTDGAWPVPPPAQLARTIAG